MMLQATHKDKGAGVMNYIRQGYMFETPNQPNKYQPDQGPSLFEQAKLESMSKEQKFVDDDDGMAINLGDADYGGNRPMGVKNLNFFKD